MHIKTLVHKGRAVALAAVATLGTGLAMAQTAATIPDASTQIASVTSNQANYSTAMFTLALTAVGIMVGVKWIKRARGAA